MTATKSGKVVLLSGGNPQIAKDDGDAPVQAYLAAVQGWRARCRSMAHGLLQTGNCFHNERIGSEMDPASRALPGWAP